MRLLVIRHGESQADILGVHEGRADFALTERGRRQAEAMSKYVSAHYDIARIYHSTPEESGSDGPGPCRRDGCAAGSGSGSDGV